MKILFLTLTLLLTTFSQTFSPFAFAETEQEELIRLKSERIKYLESKSANPNINSTSTASSTSVASPEGEKQAVVSGAEAQKGIIINITNTPVNTNNNSNTNSNTNTNTNTLSSMLANKSGKPRFYFGIDALQANLKMANANQYTNKKGEKKTSISGNVGFYLINEGLITLRAEGFIDNLNLDSTHKSESYYGDVNIVAHNIKKMYGARGIVGININDAVELFAGAGYAKIDGTITSSWCYYCNSIPSQIKPAAVYNAGILINLSKNVSLKAEVQQTTIEAKNGYIGVPDAKLTTGKAGLIFKF